MNILSKKEFCCAIGDLKRNEELISTINDVFNEFRNESSIFSTGLESTVINLLETIFEDKENHYISYWLWEENFGETYEDGDIVDSDDSIIKLKTAEDLYDFLINNMSKKESNKDEHL